MTYSNKQQHLDIDAYKTIWKDMHQDVSSWHLYVNGIRLFYFVFIFNIYTSRFYCNHYVTFGVCKMKKRAKQHVLFVLMVLLIWFLCRWPSWKILYVPDI